MRAVFVQRAVVALGHQRPQDRLARRVDPQRATTAMRFGTTTALRARLLTPEIYLERPIPKRRATSVGGNPASPASNTRSRRSAEQGLGIAASSLPRNVDYSTHAQGTFHTQAKTALITAHDPLSAPPKDNSPGSGLEANSAT